MTRCTRPAFAQASSRLLKATSSPRRRSGRLSASRLGAWRSHDARRSPGRCEPQEASCVSVSAGVLVHRKSAARRILGRPWRWLLTFTTRAIFARGQLDTGQRIGLDELGIDAPGREEYAPSGWLFARRMLRGYSITPDDVFVDIGSGQGRMVYM